MACNDTRPLTQAQIVDGLNPRTGVTKAIRPFTGEATPENLIDYLNREVYPVLRAAREKLNEIYQQVADQAPSANPLSYFFSVSTVNADPTAGFIRLNQAVQNTATVIRVSEQNARLVSTLVWLDVMAGSATVPIGVVTISDSIDPSRFVRFNLNSMVDNGSYWDLTVTPVESSHPNPFVADESVVIGFIPSIATGGVVAAPGVAAPPDSEYVLGAADVDLPNGRVASDSVEIDVDATVAGTITWNLRDGSVDVARLEDQLAGTICAQALTATAPPRFWDGSLLAGAGIDWTPRLSNGPSPVPLSVDASVREQVFSNSLATSIAVALPTERVAGQRIHIVVQGTAFLSAGLSPLVTPAGWTRVIENGISSMSGVVFERILDGTETSPLTITTSVASTHLAHVQLISDGSTTLPAQASQRSTVGTTNDPPAVSPTTGIARYLSLQYLLIDAEQVLADPAGFPSGYNNRDQFVQTGGGFVDGTIAYASLEASAVTGSIDPATWTIPTSGNTFSFNVAVPPLSTYALDVSASGAQIASSVSVNPFVYAAPNRNRAWSDMLDSSLSYTSSIVSGSFPVSTTRACLTSDTRSLTHSFACPPEMLAPELATRALLWITTCIGSTITTPTGWTLVASVNTAGSRQSCYLQDIAAGGAPAANPVAITVGTSCKVFGQFKTLVDYDQATPPEAITATVAAATSLDMGTLTPSWGLASNDYTLTIGFTNETTGTAVVFPAGYTGGTQTQISGAAAADDGGFAIAHQQIRGTSEDPAAITWTGASDAHALLVGVAPARTGKISVNLSTLPQILPVMTQEPPAQEPGEFIPRGWHNALRSNPRTGGASTFWDVGDFANFGLDGPTTSSPQIRSGDAVFRIRGTNQVSVIGDTIAVLAANGGNASVQSTTNDVKLQASANVSLETGGLPRVVIASTGEWTTPAGANLNVFTHRGAGTPPTWGFVALGSLATQAANTFVANATAGVAVPTAVASNAEGVMGRTSGNIQSIDSAVQTALIRAAGSVFWASCAADQVLCRSGAGNLGFQSLPLTALASQVADTFVGRLAGAGAPTAQTLSSLASTSIVYDAASHTFQSAALTGDVTAAQNSNTTAIAAGVIVDADVNAAAAIALTKLAPWVELEHATTSGTINNLVRTGDARSIMLVPSAALAVTGVASGNVGDMIALNRQGATSTLTLNDNDVGSTATNRFAHYKDANIRLGDDELALYLATDLTSGGTNDKRWMCFTHRAPFCNTTTNVVNDTIVHDGTDWQVKVGGNTGRLLRTRVYATAVVGATHTFLAESSFALVDVVSSGGGGGACANPAAGECALGSGGGSGIWVAAVWPITTATVTYTVGTGAASAASGNISSITDGTNSISVPGGSAGTSIASGTTNTYLLGGSSVSNPTIVGTPTPTNYDGTTLHSNNGGPAHRDSGTSGLSGAGAPSPYGGGGVGGRIASGIGIAGAAHGAGGGGAISFNAGGAFAGGASPSGIIVIREYS